jgi:hypothetical protein
MMSKQTVYRNLEGYWSSHFPMGSGLMSVYVFLPENQYHYITLLQKDILKQYNGHYGTYETVHNKVTIHPLHGFYWDSSCTETSNGCFPNAKANLVLRPTLLEKTVIGDLSTLNTQTSPITVQLIVIGDSSQRTYFKIGTNPYVNSNVSHFLEKRELLFEHYGTE